MEAVDKLGGYDVTLTKKTKQFSKYVAGVNNTTNSERGNKISWKN